MKEHLRKIMKNDLIMIFNWRNHADIRNNSFEKEELSLNEHKEWFNNILKSDFITTYILEVDGTPVGVIRFEIDRIGAAKINYYIDPLKHGKGLGTEILKLGMKKIFVEKIELKKVYGYVLTENLASIRIFEKLSFKKVLGNTSEIKYEKYK
jgi:RimJ/RimL family protein N-acetyltransferase